MTRPAGDVLQGVYVDRPEASPTGAVCFDVRTCVFSKPIYAALRQDWLLKDPEAWLGLAFIDVRLTKLAKADATTTAWFQAPRGDQDRADQILQTIIGQFELLAVPFLEQIRGSEDVIRLMRENRFVGLMSPQLRKEFVRAWDESDRLKNATN